jgi:glycosyltransferase involved in cell wall biosynthesis
MESKNRPVVVCVGFDWHHPSPLRHLECALADDHELVHVESIGLRVPRPTRADLGRALWKVGRAFGWRAVRGGPDRRGVRIVAPLVVPVHGSDAVRRLNAHLVTRAVRRALPRDRSPDLLLTSLPTAVDLLDGIGARRTAYYRVDDWPRWHGIDGTLMTRLEGALMDRSDVTFCTSRELLATAHGRGRPAVYLPQGVDREHFAAAARPGPVHAAVADLPGPVLGFFGTLDDRLDGNLLSHLDRHWPGTVALVGELRGDAPVLPAGGTVRHLGAVDYRDLPDLARGVDAWLLPYVVGDRTRAIDPLKLREYLATGAPVVATPLPEVVRWEPHVSVAATPSEFLAAAKSAVDDPGRGREQRLASLDGHTWADRRRTFLAALPGGSLCRA